jgi:hypothetical protein
VFLHKITLPPYVPYIHLLVDYHFGFTKRALIGAVVSLFAREVPVWLVFALGGGSGWSPQVSNCSVAPLASTGRTCRCSYSWRARRSF